MRRNSATVIGRRATRGLRASVAVSPGKPLSFQVNDMIALGQNGKQCAATGREQTVLESAHELLDAADKQGDHAGTAAMGVQARRLER